MGPRNCIVIAGGGTGGHVIPALAIAESIKAKSPKTEIHFVGTSKGLETKLVPKEGYLLHLIPVSGLKNLSLSEKLKSLCLIPIAFLKSMRILFLLKPKVVLGVGGYASGPFLLMASLLGYRTAIWEPNAFPGLTNRLLSRFVSTAFVVFEDCKKYLKSKNLIFSGMPLRKNIGPKPREPSKKLRLFVFGGSQGARAVNSTVSEALIESEDIMNHVEVVHQTGALDFEKVKAKYESGKLPVEAHAFIYDMDRRYAWADLVVCRAGASTVAEVAASHKAAIFVPFPFASDDHQKKNAESLAHAGAAILVDQKDLTPKRFLEILNDFIKNPQKISSMEKKVAQFHRPNASDQIADALLNS